MSKENKMDALSEVFGKEEGDHIKFLSSIEDEEIAESDFEDISPEEWVDLLEDMDPFNPTVQDITIVFPLLHQMLLDYVDINSEEVD